MNDRINMLQATVAMAMARQAILKKYNLDSVGENTLIEETEKMIEDEKKLEFIKARQPQVIQTPVKKSWQDNIWLFLIIGIAIGAVGLILGQMILNAIAH